MKMHEEMLNYQEKQHKSEDEAQNLLVFTRCL